MIPLALVAVACGVTAVAVAGATSYRHLRGAIEPLHQDGEPTRAAIEATRPFAARSRVRLVVRHAVLAAGWLTVALYGLGLAAAGALAR
ncbi:MAG: hypothetical protein H6Q36_1602 [Chloroflexi bacterium]|nr:hypothetical protein [Chloroflexota bacterium]